MHDLHPDDLERRREVAVDRYILAFDQGDLETIAEIVAQAVDDPELDRRLIGINAALHAEFGLRPIEEQGRLVRRLAYRYLPSGVPAPDEPPRPVTVGEVVASLKADHAKGHPLPPGGAAANERLLTSDVPIPVPVTAAVVARMAEDLHVVASDRYWERFRRTAVMLAMARQRDKTLHTAARRQNDGRSRVDRKRKPTRREEQP
jgi:hypothetical protein